MQKPISLIARAFVALFIAVLLVPAAPLHAQPDDDDPRIRVFLDCPRGGCDRNFFITELPYAIWTQDRLDADIHLLITRIETGSGGNEFTLQFIAQRRMGMGTDTLITAVEPNSSDDMQRRALTRMIHIGLVGRAARVRGRARFVDQLSVEYEAPPGMEDANTAAQQDRWNLWIYRADLNANGSAESRRSEYELSGGFSARRITEKWKIDLDIDNEYRSRTIELSDGAELFILRSGDFSANVVRSLTDHWSVGGRTGVGLAEFRNQDAFASSDLSIEWNYFPWREATARQLVGILSVGSRYFDYREITLFGRTTELRGVARAVLAGESNQQWGTVNGSLRYTQYLHDRRRYNLSFFGRTEIRLSRGLALVFQGNASRVNDQLFLQREDLSDDDVLTQQRALATNFELRGSVGVSFTFGSIYNNIVNPRLDRIRGGGGGGR